MPSYCHYFNWNLWKWSLLVISHVISSWKILIDYVISTPLTRSNQMHILTSLESHFLPGFVECASVFLSSGESLNHGGVVTWIVGQLPSVEVWSLNLSRNKVQSSLKLKWGERSASLIVNMRREKCRLRSLMFPRVSTNVYVWPDCWKVSDVIWSDHIIVNSFSVSNYIYLLGLP